MIKNILTSIRILILMVLLTGIVYPFFITGIAQVFFREKANGSLIKKDGKVIGSKLIGRKFTSGKYFWGRPSASDYGTIPSAGSNLGYTSADLKKNIDERRKLFGNEKDIPEDLLFSSASGIDPDISPEAARFQINRVAKERNFNDIQTAELKKLVEKSIKKRQFGILGEERINVLLLNIELDKIK
jgi:potassium-transporting ATPase KdpC subunit